VATVLLYLAPSIVIYIGRDLITRVFYAYKDSKTPYYVGLAAIVMKSILDFSFVYQLKMGVAGIALATTLITIFNFTCLSLLLGRKIGPLGMKTMIKPVAIMLVASVVAGLATHFAFAWVTPWLAKTSATLHLIALLVSIGAASAMGMAIYTGITIVCKLEEPTLLMQRLKLLPKDKSG
jgi:putative peptidoglycan lipid II flippase